ncbi:MAG: DCC1-like thiol-disulfide oxidoreductase family protein [bacterium]|nr:DCC1-like thiol-disulfide oxidoreductase family protein [bacterium]MDZ4260489.1 DCC1-like thiol-disulfide oxidoreductase family protein [Candidatus Sungbacteria bacterium]
MPSQDYATTRSEFPAGSIIVFDDTCNLCNGAINFVLDHDKKKLFYFADRDGLAARKLKMAARLPNYISEQTIVLFTDTTHYVKSRAVLEIMKGLGFPYSLAYPAIIIPTSIRDSFYDIISKKRYLLFGKSNTCRVMTDEIRPRFL